MTEQYCNTITDLLVPYADGELSEVEARWVADHLAGCPDCRAELRLLEQSLELARAVWHESARQAPTVEIRRPRSRRLSMAAAMVACAALLLLALAPWLLRPESAERQTAQPIPIEQPAEEADFDVEEYIAREGRSARLAAAVELLATQPGLEEYRQRAEQYLIENYGDTTAVRGTSLPN